MEALMNQIRPIPANLACPVSASNEDYVAQWLAGLDTALRAGDKALLLSLFAHESHWRDLLAFTWKITPHEGAAAIADALISAQPQTKAGNFERARGRTPPRRTKRAGTDVIEAIFSFETAKGRGHGVVRLLADEPGKACVLMTSLDELKGYEEPINSRRPSGSAYSRNFGGDNWSDLRETEQAFADREPAVLIIGAGQAGLSLTARLKRLGVDTLVIEKLPRVGDVWRERYHSLALHNQVGLNHLPYMPFPPSWPKYLAKDMLANWLESYAWAMECNVWTGTTFLGGSYDEAGIWQARVRRADGSERLLRPRHLVFANGIVGRPKVPKLLGIEQFKGEVLHTHAFRNGAAWRRKRALVLGSGVSAHDVAQDLHSHGATVKLIQRGSTTVVSVESAALVHSLYYDEGLPLEDCDLIAASSTYPLLVRGYQLAVKRQLEIDKDLIAGLKAKGFKLDMGEDGTGHQMKFPATLRGLLSQLRLLGAYHQRRDRLDPVRGHRALRGRRRLDEGRTGGKSRSSGNRHGLPEPAGGRAAAARGGDRQQGRFNLGNRCRWRIGEHVQANGAKGLVVHWWRPGACAHLLPLHGVANQGTRGGLDQLIRRRGAERRWAALLSPRLEAAECLI